MLRTRQVAQLALLLIASTATSFVSQGQPPAQAHTVMPQAERPVPNILLFITDDQREGLRVMPKTRKRFHEGGIQFTNAFASTPLCCPSRASIYTGRYPHNHGVLRMEESQNLDQRTTIQYLLQREGFRTGMFGKFFSNWPASAAPPYFDEWAFFRKSGAGYSGVPWNVNGEVRDVKRYTTLFLQARAIEFLERAKRQDPRRPWFMVVATGAPHAPFTPHRKYRDARVPGYKKPPSMGEKDRSDKPQYVQDQNSTITRNLEIRRQQFRTLMTVDDMVGAVFSKMDQLNETRDTLAFYISDNGLMWGDHRLSKKAVPYQGAVRVPFMMRWPGEVGGEIIDPRLTGNIDIAPTIAEVARVPQADVERMDGRSLMFAGLRDRFLIEYKTDNNGSESLGTFKSPTWASLISTDYQYVENYTDDGSEVTFLEYYDLVNDPYQLVNLLGDTDETNDPKPALLNELSGTLQSDRQCHGINSANPCP